MRLSKNEYVFCSERLGFRNWCSDDLEPMAQINNDPRVMEFFPSVQSRDQTAAFIERMQNQFRKSKYCYFATAELATGNLIGFIGLMYKDNLPQVVPGVDIGWRLSANYWNKGYALEGARATLNYGFNTLELESVMAIAPTLNLRSEKIMKRLGMQKKGEFKHPELEQFPSLEICLLYELNHLEWKKTI